MGNLKSKQVEICFLHFNMIFPWEIWSQSKFEFVFSVSTWFSRGNFEVKASLNLFFLFQHDFPVGSLKLKQVWICFLHFNMIFPWEVWSQSKFEFVFYISTWFSREKFETKSSTNHNLYILWYLLNHRK